MTRAVLLVGICFGLSAFSPYSAEAQTGKCIQLTEQIKQKNWDAINYKYSQRYIADNRGELEAAVNGAADQFHKHCDSVTLSDEQLAGQQVLDLAASPIKEVADGLLKGMGLPPLGDKALHIDIKDIEKYGPLGGPCSVLRNPLGHGC